MIISLQQLAAATITITAILIIRMFTKPIAKIVVMRTKLKFLI